MLDSRSRSVACAAIRGGNPDAAGFLTFWQPRNPREVVFHAYPEPRVHCGVLPDGPARWPNGAGTRIEHRHHRRPGVRADHAAPRDRGHRHRAGGARLRRPAGARWSGAASTAPTCCCWTTACRAWTGWSSPVASAACPCTATFPVILITVVGDEPIRQAALEAGVIDFLVKPVRPRELRARCATCCSCASSRRTSSSARCRWSSACCRACTRSKERERETLSRLARAIEYRDSGTSAFLERMARIAALVAEQLGMGEEDVRAHRAGRAPARHGQDRHPRRGADEARPAGRRGAGDHAPASEDRP